MAASAEVFAPDTHTENGDWTIVLPRGGKQRKYIPRVRASLSGEQQLWVPTDPKCSPERQSMLMQKMQSCLEKLGSSQFFVSILDQIQTPEILCRFRNVLGSELKMQMVIYGIGNIESGDRPRLQLALALLIKRQFSWIGGIEVFDPVLTATECQVLESLGCTVLSVNEHGRRQATKPTLFFMPHCEAELYDNLLQANWTVDLLSNFVMFGNNFEVYKQALDFKYSSIVDVSKHILAAKKFTDEYVVKTISDDYFAAFHDSTWHFFNPKLVSDFELSEHCCSLKEGLILQKWRVHPEAEGG